jgi:DNA invertase Pin-like site-specific DNA recombinase
MYLRVSTDGQTTENQRIALEEVTIIQERIRAGIARARQNGTKSGRPIGRPRVKEETLEKVRTALAKGHSLRQAVKETGISIGIAAREEGTECVGGAGHGLTRAEGPPPG